MTISKINRFEGKRIAVIPVKTGIQKEQFGQQLDPRLRGDDGGVSAEIMALLREVHS